MRPPVKVARCAVLIAAIAVGARPGAAEPAGARAEPPEPLPGVRVDLATGARVGGEARLVVGDDYGAVVPAVRAQLGDRRFALGLELGLAAVSTSDPALTGFADDTASGVAPANLVVDGKAVRCRADRSWCLGLDLSVGLALVEPDTPGRLAGLYAGTAAHQGRLSRFVERGLTLEPLAALRWTRGRYQVQVGAGPTVLLTRDDVEERQLQVHLSWEVEAARWLGPRVALAVGAGGVHDLRPRLAEWPRKDVARDLPAVSATVHLRAGPWTPLARVTVPLAGYRELATVVVTVAVARPL